VIQQLSAPEKLLADHDVSGFECGYSALDDWLRSRALANEETGASRTYVVCVDQGNGKIIARQVVGYYALAVGAVSHTEAPGRVRRNMPDPIPVMILGRLAVHKNYQGRRIGPALLRDAVLRTLRAAEIAGIRAILVHAISEDAKQFYERSGFSASPLNPMTLMVTLAQASRILTSKMG
jgi:GNAT superfamily N-acetyltransferase